MRLHLLLLALLLIGQARADESIELRPIFNGRDLTGWDGDPRFWSVRNGVIHGETTMKTLTLNNTFLIWRGGALRDFELRLKFRIQSGNSGIQYRSQELGHWVVSGYQAEIENRPDKVGLLYEERGRKFLAHVGEKVTLNPEGQRLVGSLAPKDSTLQQSAFKPREWNDYRILARGGHLEHWINGIQVVDLLDQDRAHATLEGLLALQIHAGPPMVVEFKDLSLKHL